MLREEGDELPPKRMQLAIAGIAVALAAAAVTVGYVGSRAVLRPIRVVVATRQVPPMTPIQPNDLRVETIPKGQLLARGVTSHPQVVVGRMSLYGLYPGEIISSYDIAPFSPSTSLYAARLTELRAQALNTAKIARKAALAVLSVSGKKLAAAIQTAVAGSTVNPSTLFPPAQGGLSTAQSQAETQFAGALAALRQAERSQAVTVAVSEQQGFALTQPGDHIALYGTIAGSQHQMVAYQVSRDTLVLGNLGTAAGGAVNGAVSGVLVLAMTPAQIERLMLAQQAGTIMAVEEPLGGDAETTPGQSTSSLLGTGTAGTTKPYPTTQSANQPSAVAP